MKLTISSRATLLEVFLVCLVLVGLAGKETINMLAFVKEQEVCDSTETHKSLGKQNLSQMRSSLCKAGIQI